MKTKKCLVKLFLFLFLGTFVVLPASSQDSYIFKRWNIKLGYAQYKQSRMSGGIQETCPNLRLELNYGITNYLETGIYFGLSPYEFATIIDTLTTQVIFTKKYPPFYGINMNFHILPFFIKQDDFRFDAYLTGKYGGYYFNISEDSPLHGHNNEYVFGGGISFYPWKHLGIYTEFCYGNYLYEDLFREDHYKLRYGISYKF